MTSPPPDRSGIAEGPWFEDLEVGQEFSAAPALTLTSGRAAVHQGIVGDRLRLPLDDELAMAVAGRAPLAHPGFVWDVSIGQSTTVTHNVKANLFYRGLVLRRHPVIGDTLHTVTRVVGLRQNAPRPERPATGLAALRITTSDQSGRVVLDFVRCAMIPLRDPAGLTGRQDDLDALVPARGSDEDPAWSSVVADWQWDLQAYRSRVGAEAAPAPGVTWTVGGGDVVSSAPELARLTLNLAKVHHDSTQGQGRRLVYGGHTVGVALSQACRALPGIVSVVGWQGCDHTGPVFEGDTLRSTITTERWEPLTAGGGLAHLRSLVTADAGPADAATRPVLDWRFVALVA